MELFYPIMLFLLHAGDAEGARPELTRHPVLFETVEACEAEGKALGRLATTAEEAERLLDLGYRILAVGLDIDLYRRGLARELSGARAHLR